MYHKMDKENTLFLQAYAAPQLVEDRGFDDAVYGFGSGVFFVGYMVHILRLEAQI